MHKLIKPFLAVGKMYFTIDIVIIIKHSVYFLCVLMKDLVNPFAYITKKCDIRDVRGGGVCIINVLSVKS